MGRIFQTRLAGPEQRGMGVKGLNGGPRFGKAGTSSLPSLRVSG